MKPARLLKPIASKRPGAWQYTNHRVGSKCLAQRHGFQPGVWILWFGHEYATVEGKDLPTTIKFEEQK